MIIQPTKGLRFLDLRELAHYRELIYFLTLRDIKVRYKQTVIGVAWAVLQPLAMMVVFTVFFGKFAKLEGEVVGPYWLFAFAGLLPWQLFARTLTESSNSLVTEQRLVTKVYFPRIIVPMSSCLAAIVDFVIGLVLLLAMMAAQGIFPSWRTILLPFFVLLMLTASMGVGFWLSALNTEYRDVRYVVPFLAQFWMFVTPVVYPSSIVPENYQWLLALNPMTGVIDGIRWSLISGGEPPIVRLVVSTIVAITVFLTGIVWFRWRERSFVDHLGGQ